MYLPLEKNIRSLFQKTTRKFLEKMENPRKSKYSRNVLKKNLEGDLGKYETPQLEPNCHKAPKSKLICTQKVYNEIMLILA